MSEPSALDICNFGSVLGGTYRIVEIAHCCMSLVVGQERDTLENRVAVYTGILGCDIGFLEAQTVS